MRKDTRFPGRGRGGGSSKAFKLKEEALSSPPPPPPSTPSISIPVSGAPKSMKRSDSSGLSGKSYLVKVSASLYFVLYQYPVAILPFLTPFPNSPHAQENDRLKNELEREKAHRRQIETRCHDFQQELEKLKEQLLHLEGSDGMGINKTAIGGFAFLKSIPLFQTLSEAQLSKLSTSLETRRFEDGDVIIRQDDPGHSFYIVESGEVVVTRAGESNGSPGSESTLMTLGPGDYFGERALLTDENRAATCTAKGGVMCQVLVRETFTDALSSVSDLLGDRLKEYEHDLNETSVQALER